MACSRTGSWAELSCDSRHFFSLQPVVVTGPRGRQDLSYAVFFFFLLWKQESQCNPSKIVCLSLAQVEEPSNKEAPRITASFQQSPNATGTYFESCRVEGRVLASLYPKVVVRTGAAFMPLGECVRFLFYLDHCQ